MRLQSSQMLIVGVAMLVGGYLFGAMYCDTIMRDAPIRADIASVPSPPRAKPTSRVEAMKILNDWFSENGGKLHENVVLRERQDLPDVWGFYAIGEVKEKDVVIAVPQHIILNSHTALHGIVSNMNALRAKSSLPAVTLTPRLIIELFGFVSDYGVIKASKEAKEAGNSAMQVAVIALFLSINFDDSSHFFYPYFATLPKGCQMSTCWSKERIEAVFVEKEVKSILADQRYYRLIARSLGINEEDYLEKISLVASRFWRDSSMEHAATLVPVADMINHAAAREGEALNTFSSRNFKGSYLLQEGGTKHAGDEIHDSYGQKHNGKLLRDYGFILDKNPVDTCDNLSQILNEVYIKNVLKRDCPVAPSTTLYPADGKLFKRLLTRGYNF
eukprot:gb/GEZN01009102.1/.p1 GENE.gb/GEZN01009102.1/~~gb/GEZN01009102.1/.p1  ORF type:complete len:387 (+),score=36.34 gb/GEZN01009102.1/:120-1280(+)